MMSLAVSVAVQVSTCLRYTTQVFHGPWAHTIGSFPMFAQPHVTMDATHNTPWIHKVVVLDAVMILPGR